MAFAAVADRLGFSQLAISLLRAVARRYPQMQRMAVSQLAYMAERRGELKLATEILTESGPPASDGGFYFVELGNLLERQARFSEALDAYHAAMEREKEFSPEFIEWSQSRINEVRKHQQG